MWYYNRPTLRPGPGSAALRVAAREAFDADPSPENKAKKEAAEAAYDETVEEHDDLPHEFDAERMEDKIKKRVGDTQ